MTITPTEFARFSEAEHAFDAICRTAGLTLTASQRGRALAELDAQLAVLRRAWIAADRVKLFEELRGVLR